jgi:hypothetical protein
MEAAGTAKRWCAFTRIYGVTPQKSISILYLEVCRFDVKGNEEGIHDEIKDSNLLFSTQLPWFISVGYVIGGM